jgi:hypothetical protein
MVHPSGPLQCHRYVQPCAFQLPTSLPLMTPQFSCNLCSDNISVIFRRLPVGSLNQGTDYLIGTFCGFLHSFEVNILLYLEIDHNFLHPIQFTTSIYNIGTHQKCFWRSFNWLREEVAGVRLSIEAMSGHKVSQDHPWRWKLFYTMQKQ